MAPKQSLILSKYKSPIHIYKKTANNSKIDSKGFIHCQITNFYNSNIFKTICFCYKIRIIWTKRDHISPICVVNNAAVVYTLKKEIRGFVDVYLRIFSPSSSVLMVAGERKRIIGMGKSFIKNY